MQNLEGLERLERIGSSIYIHANQQITSLTGLDNLVPGSVSDLTIINNPSLTECSVAGICNYLSSPNGYVYINGNATGCNNLSEISEGCGSPIGCLPQGTYTFNLDKVHADAALYPA